jgi:hypothetical protein
MKYHLGLIPVLLTGLLLGTACDAQPRGGARTLTTSGHGQVEVKPDKAVVSMRVEATFKSGATAKAEVDKGVNRLLASLDKLGLEKDDVVASSLRIFPRFDYREGEQHFAGYTASRDVTVTLDELGKLNALLDTALDSGINRIGNIALEVSDEEKYRLQARQKAIADSKEKASALATAYGAELGPISSISYQAGQVHYPGPREAAAMRVSADSGGGQYLHDDITFSDDVQVVFDLIVPH